MIQIELRGSWFDYEDTWTPGISDVLSLYDSSTGKSVHDFIVESERIIDEYNKTKHKHYPRASAVFNLRLSNVLEAKVYDEIGETYIRIPLEDKYFDLDCDNIAYDDWEKSIKERYESKYQSVEFKYIGTYNEF